MDDVLSKSKYFNIKMILFSCWCLQEIISSCVQEVLASDPMMSLLSWKVRTLYFPVKARDWSCNVDGVN